jgi:uncharacterized repeat protein (TIGR01451 family)
MKIFLFDTPPATGFVFKSIVSSLILLCSFSAFAAKYIVLDLTKTLAPNEASVGTALNNSGEVVGSLPNASGEYQYFLYANGTSIFLNTPSSSSGVAGINIHRDLLVGSYHVIHADGTSDSLGNFGASAINDSRQFAGYGPSGFLDYTTPARLESNGSITLIGYLEGLENGADIRTEGVTAINKHGVVVGYSNINGHSTEVHAFSYDSARIDLQGADNPSYGAAHGINSAGKIVGYSSAAFNGSAAVALWEQAGKPIILPVPNHSFVGGINDSAEIVGAGYDDRSGTTSPFVYRYSNSKSKYIDLQNAINISSRTPKSLWTNLFPRAINAGGQITGTATIEGKERAFLASPFYRQIDAPQDPDIPERFGNTKPTTGKRSLTYVQGCALCAAATVARSLIGQSSLHDDIPIITPKLLDNLLIATRHYKDNEITFESVFTVLKNYANITYVGSPAFTQNTLPDVLEREIYTNGNRVLINFNYAANNFPQDHPHFAWVVGRQGSEWQIADGGWASAKVEAIGSLAEHQAGFLVTLPRGGLAMLQFTPSQLYVFKNLDYAVPSSKASVQGRLKLNDKQASSQMVVIVAKGPVDFFVTDPSGRRVGLDSATGDNFSEIPQSTYYSQNAIEEVDENSNLVASTFPTVRSAIINPQVGDYNITAVGNAVGTASVRIEVVGDGGSSDVVDYDEPVEQGLKVVRQFSVPEPGVADLQVEQSVIPRNPEVGNELIFKVKVTNRGPEIATLPKLTAILPDEADFVSAKLEGRDFYNAERVVSIPLTTLAIGESKTVEITLLPKLSGPLEQFVMVSGFKSDPQIGNNSATIVTNVTVSYEAWLKVNFSPEQRQNAAVSGPESDPDEDGIPNLLEYSLNLLPWIPDIEGLPTIGIYDSHAVLSFNKRAGVTDVLYQPQISTDLITWKDFGGSVSDGTLFSHFRPDQSESVTIVAEEETTPSPGRFLRLKVIKQ